MSSWFDYDDDDDNNNRKIDIDDEIWADTFLRLAPKTLLWAYLHRQDLTQDYIKFSNDDLEKARISFINCGYPLVLKTCNTDRMAYWLDNLKPFIHRDPDSRNYCYDWIVDLNKLADVNTLSDKEIAFFYYNEQIARDLLTLVNLNVDYYEMGSTRKTEIGIFPRWLYNHNYTIPPQEEIKKRIKSWKHIPQRYQ